MADAAPAPAHAVAPAPSSPAPGGAPAPQQPHYSLHQPRAAGRFDGPPVPTPPEEPKAPAEGQPAAPPPPPQKLKIPYKADGKDYEEELGVDELGPRLALARSARQRFEEAARLRKEAAEQEQRFQQALRDPRRFLGLLQEQAQALGVDPTEFLASSLEAALPPAREMTPEQRQAWESQQRAEALERQLQEYQQREQAAMQERAMEQARETLLPVIEQAVQQHGLPRTPKVLGQLIDTLALAGENGVAMSPSQAAELVKEDLLDQTAFPLVQEIPPEAIDSKHPLWPWLVKVWKHVHGRTPQGQRAQQAPRAAQPPAPSQPGGGGMVIVGPSYAPPSPFAPFGRNGQS